METKETMQQRVYNELRHSLMVGVFMPGESISLRQLAGDLHTSLMPIREAVNRLIAERAFELLPNRTVQIPSMNEDKLAELMKWRRVLEGSAAEESCLNYSDTDIRDLESINERMTKSVRKNELQETLLRNQEFHFHIYTRSNNTVILPIIESLWLQTGPFMYYSLAAPKTVWDGSHHLKAIDSIRNRDPSGLRKAIQSDIKNTASFLLRSHLFKKAAPRPVN